jgi:hypothetical protein
VKPRKWRAGESGTRIYKRSDLKGRRPSGRSPGVSGTPAQQAASRINPIKDGRHALVATVKDKLAQKFDRVRGKGAAEVEEAFRDQIFGGDARGVDALAASGLADLELVRRGLSRAVKKQGAVLREAIVSPADGSIVGERIKAHPGIDPLIKISETLGFSSQARRLDPRSRGEGARDDAVARLMERDKLLRGWSKDGMAPPPPPADEDVVDTELVD